MAPGGMGNPLDENASVVSSRLRRFSSCTRARSRSQICRSTAGRMPVPPCSMDFTIQSCADRQAAESSGKYVCIKSLNRPPSLSITTACRVSYRANDAPCASVGRVTFGSTRLTACPRWAGFMLAPSLFAKAASKYFCASARMEADSSSPRSHALATNHAGDRVASGLLGSMMFPVFRLDIRFSWLCRLSVHPRCRPRSRRRRPAAPARSTWRAALCRYQRAAWF